MLMCTRYGAKVVAAHSPELATGRRCRARSSTRRPDRCSGSASAGYRAYSRSWCRAAAGHADLRQGLLAGYILAAPILQAVSCALMPVAIASVFVLKMPIGLTMFMFAPLIPMALTIVSMLAGIRRFGHDYGQKVRLRHYASIMFLTPLYQVILAMAAVVAVVKYLRRDKGWYKTARMNEHDARPPRSRQSGPNGGRHDQTNDPVAADADPRPIGPEPVHSANRARRPGRHPVPAERRAAGRLAGDSGRGHGLEPPGVSRPG